jgi:glycosyltransferase involved in cell wall biosynthesis
MVPYKRMDLIVEAFATTPQRRLVVIGDGPEARRIRSRGAPNVEFLGQQPFDVLRDRLRRARAFVFAAEEDFGIAPVEAQACATPVVAYGKGGALETVRGLEDPSPTGVFFPEQTVPSLVDAIERFEQMEERIDADACRQNALRFSAGRFRQQLDTYVQHRWRLAQTRRSTGLYTPR